MPRDIPPAGVGIADSLGGLLARFATSAFQAVVLLIVGVLGILAGLAVFGLGVSSVVARNENATLGPLLGGVSLIAVCGGMLFRWRRLIGSRVVAYEGGLVRIQRGRPDEVMRWAEVASIQRGNVPGDDRFSVTTPKRLSLIDLSGREWVFTETLSGFERFRDLVEERTLSEMLPRAIDDLEQGRPVEFGEVIVHGDGVSFRGQGTLVWSAIAEEGFHQGKVYAMSKLLTKPYFNEPVFGMPNAHVLIRLIRHYRNQSLGRSHDRSEAAIGGRDGEPRIRESDTKIR